MDNCKYCKIDVYIYDHKCVGCRSRLIDRARPSQVQANKMISYLQQSTKLDRATLIEQYKAWVSNRD